MNIYIYILKNAITLEIKYIGKTKNLNQRHYRHISHARNINNKRHIDNWLRSINFNFTMEVIEICAIQDWKNKEIYWIKYYKDLNCKLCNHSNGGEGAGLNHKNCVGRKYSKETIEKIRQSSLNRFKCPIEIQKLKDAASKRTLSKNNNAKKAMNINTHIIYGSLKEACSSLNLNYFTETARIRNKSKKANFILI